MNLSDKNYLLIIAGFGLVIVELALGAATGFDLLLIGVIFILSGFFGVFVNSFSFALGSIIVLSFLYVFFGRKFIKAKLSIVTKSTNVDAVMAKKGTVVKKITKQNPGQVKIDGEIWRANASEEIEVGKEISVESVSGVTLRVKPN